MGKFIIEGGRRLEGEISVSGSKNAALPIIFATIATRGVTKIYNLPRISDVEDALFIIGSLGAKVDRGAFVTTVDTTSLSYRTPPEEQVRRIRASTYLIGACLSRFGRAELLPFGGCSFSHRPIDMHVSAAESFGAIVDGSSVSADSLRGTRIRFRVPSVGATVNSLILAAGAEGESRLYGCAREPHISSLVEYLRCAGAKIKVDADVITVVGAPLGGGSVHIRGDMIEAGTYLAASLITGGRVRVRGFHHSELDSFISPLRGAGVSCSARDGGIALCGSPLSEMSAVTGAYPAFPTDLQPIFAAVLASAKGGVIEERVWRGRFGYLDELARLGVSYSLSGSTARIFPSALRSGRAVARDLRGGMAAILIALGADGESVIDSGELVLRGYESLTDKLSSLGAQISYS